MARIKNFSRKQIRDLKNQVKVSRQKAIDDLAEENPELAEEKQKLLAERKDQMGFSREARQDIVEKIENLDKKSPTLTWNFNIGDLVELPTGNIGLIVRNDAQNIEMKSYEYDYDMNNTIKKNKYKGQVYVVTSDGNNWFYPRQLKVVRE